MLKICFADFCWNLPLSLSSVSFQPPLKACFGSGQDSWRKKGLDKSYNINFQSEIINKNNLQLEIGRQKETGGDSTFQQFNSLLHKHVLAFTGSQFPRVYKASPNGGKTDKQTMNLRWENGVMVLWELRHVSFRKGSTEEVMKK